MSETPGPGSGEPIVFFVHVMKTGGSTVLQSLLNTYPQGSRFPETGVDAMFEAKGSPAQLFNMPAARRQALRWVSPHAPLSAARRFAQEEQRPVAVTLILRDGLSRAVSHIRQVSRRFDHAYSYRELLDLPLLGEFFFSNHQTRALGIEESGWQEWEQCFQALAFLPQYLEGSAASFAVSPLAEAHLERAVAGLDQVDVLGLQDDFDDWWRRCRESFGWPGAPTASANVGNEQESRPAPPIPDDILDELRRRNALDTRLYDAARARLKG